MVITTFNEGIQAWKSTDCNRWASHLPLLYTCGSAASVLELGMGQYSTAAFLNRSIFPDLGRLVSIESNLDWIRESADLRHDVHAYPEPIESLLETMDLEAFDLIFVDNSDKAERRIATLKYISSRNPGHAKVLVHDWELYHEAVTGFRFGIVDDRQEPQTALVWGRE